VSYVSWVLKFAIFLALVGFVFANSQTVKLTYWFAYNLEAPLVLIMVAFFAVGIVVGLLASLASIFRLRRQVQSLKKEVKLQAAAVQASVAVPATKPAPMPELPVA
jgi:putative membrane protein